MNLLRDTRVYLCGAMSYEPDNGIEWRDALKPFLKSLGIRIFDPTNKPIDIGPERLEDRTYHKELRDAEAYDEISKVAKTIRCVDLRIVDIVDFLIVNIDISTYTVGTWEEIFLANREKKPILVHVEQSKQQAPFWLFGTIPHQHIFSEWSDIENYLLEIDSGSTTDEKRWYLFDHTRT